MVNIQLEHGTFGINPKDISRRIKWIIEASPRLIVTFHTILQENKFEYANLFSLLGKFKFKNAINQIKSFNRENY